MHRAEATHGSTLTLSVVVPTSGGWSDLDGVLDSLAPAIESGRVEVLAVSGCGGRPVQPRAGVTYLAAGVRDVFQGRAAATALASGDVVALVEDHQRLDTGWALALLNAWHEQPQADALVHSMTTHAGAGAWESTLFTMTSGPFLGVDEVPRDRLPVPGIVSFRRSLVGTSTPPPGFIEYDLMASLVTSGRVVMVDVPLPVHVQPVGWRATLLAFHSGRVFAGTRVAGHSNARGAELQRMVRDLRVVRWQTVAARRRMNDGCLGPAFIACLSVLMVAQVVGQTIGIATRSIGGSARHLE